MIAGTRDDKGARIVLRILAVALAFSMLAWVRGDVVGVATGALWVALLAYGGWRGSGKGLLFVVQFLGLQLTLTSVQSVYTLYKISAYGESQSDAGIMQNLTGIPATVWAFGWCVVSLGVVWVSLRTELGRRKGPAVGG
jgi:hypothetical protein